MKNVICLFLVCLASRPVQSQVIQVQQLNPAFDAKELSVNSDKRIESKSLDDLSKGNDFAHALPEKIVIETILKKAELDTDTATMDQLDMDQLFIRAGHFPISKVQEFYPKLPKVKLEKLIHLIKEQKK